MGIINYFRLRRFVQWINILEQGKSVTGSSGARVLNPKSSDIKLIFLNQGLSKGRAVSLVPSSVFEPQD
jgi:hypothetical protein